MSAKNWLDDALYRYRRVNRQRQKAEHDVERATIDPASIRIPLSVGEPDVSIIIPTYGKVPYTLRCLKSIAAAASRTSVEVIVVDDASADPAIAELRRIAGISVYENVENIGFLKTCNMAAKHGRGTFLHFLNNDTELQPGAVDALIELARAHPEAGIIGSKLVYPDGRLQEAGGIVWSDGSTSNYGWRDDPLKPQYNYVREVDYVSGASLLVKRTLWDSLAGFDEAFAPAYYEDTDFAFRVRHVGLKVFYQPRSVVEHHEGISHREKKNAGIGARMNKNRSRFVARWSAELKAEQFDPATHEMRARDRAKKRSIVLIVAKDQLSTEPIVNAFVQLGWIVKLCLVTTPDREDWVEQLRQRGIEVLPKPFLPIRLRRTKLDIDALIQIDLQTDR